MVLSVMNAHLINFIKRISLSDVSLVDDVYDAIWLVGEWGN